MQFEISDEAAIVIAHEFYTALAAGYPVDAALAEARKAAFTGGSSAEWGIPVLYLRAADGRIFGVTLPAQGPLPSQGALPAQGVPAVPAEPVPVQPAAVRTVVDRPAGPSRGARRWALPVAGLLAILVLVFGARQVLANHPAHPGRGAPGGKNGVAAPTTAALARATDDTLISTPTAAVAIGSTGQTLDKLLLSKPRVLSSTAWNHDLVPAADGVWAASSGGLVRWKADGTSTVFTAADGLPFNHTRALLAMPDGSMWAAANYAAAHITPDGDGLGQVRVYAEPEGLPLGESPAFMLDSDGSVWIASFYASQPIYRFDGAVWRPPELPIDDPVLTGPGARNNVHAARAGWRAVAGPQTATASCAWTARHGRTSEPNRASRGMVSGACSRTVPGFCGRLPAKAGSCASRPRRAAGSGSSYQRPDEPVYWIAQLPDGSLWASGNDSIVASTDGGRQWAPVATRDDGMTDPTAVVQDESGRVWVAASNGVGMYDGRAVAPLAARGRTGGTLGRSARRGPRRQTVDAA